VKHANSIKRRFDMSKTVSALFDTYSRAIAAVDNLEAAGISRNDISIVANNAENWHKSDAAADAGTGAGIGAIAGGGVGLATGLGIMAIPGVGPVVAAGWLAATAVGAIAGAVAGGATGGIVGAMTESGVPEHDAHVYAEGVRRGGTLVTAKVPDDRAVQATGILHSAQSVDIAARRSAYQAGGWSKFDDTAPVYTGDQVRKERGLYS
jgi:hypothetical protein